MGYLLSFVCAFFISSRDLVSKKVSHDTSGVASAFASFLFALPYYLIILLILFFLKLETFSFSLLFIFFVLVRSSTDAVAEWSKMAAFRYGDISYLSVFMSFYPVYLLFLGPLIGDKITLLGIVGVILMAIGSFVVVKSAHPRSTENKDNLKKGIILAFIASFFFALNTIFDRLAVQKGTPVMAGFSMTLVAAILLLPIFLKNRTQNLLSLRKNNGFFLFRGLLETIFMISKLTALRYLATPYVASIMRLSLFLSILGGKVFFKEKHTTERLWGALISFVGLILIFVS